MIITIYKHTNTMNGKVYIGQTCQTMKERWDSGHGYKANKHFFAAIKKYGVKVFTHEIICYGFGKEDGDFWEQHFIAKYDSTNQDKGYNLDLGGKGKGRMSEETKKKLSEANKGKPSPTKGKPISDEQKRHLSRINMGKKVSEETKRKISNTTKGRPKSEETKKKMAAAQPNKLQWTEEQIKEILDLSISSHQLAKQFN